MSVRLSTALFFGLTIPFIMTYRLGSGDTPYIIFSLIFLLLFSSVGSDLFLEKKKYYEKLKSAIYILLITLTLGSGFWASIVVRHITHPIYQIHDIILQLEAAIRFLLDGVNPYSATYFGTFLEQWHYSDTAVNPALYHFVMEPFYLLFSVPFYGVAVKTLGFFDGRMPLFFLFFAMLLISGKIIKDHEKKWQFIALLAFNPATIGYTLEGRSDVFMLSFLLAGLYLLHLGRNKMGGIFVGFAFMVKQSIWPFFPFYFFYIFFKNKKNLKKTFVQLVPFTITCIIITLPFFVWDPNAYITSTILYLSGNTEYSYPISGYGFGVLAHQLGWIKSLTAPFPFVILQAIFCVPLLVFLIRYLSRRNSLRLAIILYAVFLLVYWYFSRYFNNSHIAYISTIILVGYFWPDEKK